MPPDSERFSTRRSMFQRHPASGGDFQTRVGSSDSTPTSNDRQRMRPGDPRRKDSRKTRDLVVAMCAAFLVSCFLSIFRPSFESNLRALEHELHGSPVPSSRQINPRSDNIIQVVNTRYVLCFGNLFCCASQSSHSCARILAANRFQQSQPHLATLGRARLELFKAFCLPSMIRQTNQDFLWLIQTDPDLDAELLNEMTRLLSPYPNFYLIKSAHRKKWPLTRNWTNRHFNESSVVTGDKEVLMKAYNDVPEKILIESSLDADDGLAYYVLQDIRDDTVRRLDSVAEQYLSVRKNGWFVTCYHQFIGWYPEDMTNDAVPDDTSGGLRIDLRHDKFCPTPALTIASVPRANYTYVPIRRHNQLVTDVPRCQTDVQTMCLHGVGEIPSSVRARTPSSAGMDNIGEKEGHKQNVQHLWAYLDHLFGVKKDDVARAGRYFKEHSKAIARENLEGLW